MSDDDSLAVSLLKRAYYAAEGRSEKERFLKALHEQREKEAVEAFQQGKTLASVICELEK